MGGNSCVTSNSTLFSSLYFLLFYFHYVFVPVSSPMKCPNVCPPLSKRARKPVFGVNNVWLINVFGAVVQRITNSFFTIINFASLILMPSLIFRISVYIYIYFIYRYFHIRPSYNSYLSIYIYIYCTCIGKGTLIVTIGLRDISVSWQHVFLI